MTQQIQIPGTDLSIFPINLGTNTFGWTADEATSHAILDAFVAAGGNFLDTAESYPAWVPGNTGRESETIIGTWLAARGNRDKVVIATKVGDHPEHQTQDPAYIRTAIDASLQRLQTDHVDLYYAHRDDEVTPIAEVARVFDEIVRAGKAKHIAVSNYSKDRLAEWLAVAEAENLAKPVAIQPQYSLVFRRDYETELAPLAREHNLGVFTYFSLAAGFLTGKYRTETDLEGASRGGMVQGYFNADGLTVVDEMVTIAEAHDVAPATVALAWLLAKGMTAPIVSARTPEQLDDLMAAPELTLSEDEVTRLDRSSAPFA
ncbi:aldo/keto reductase [Brevibacterium aurantiacum]|uniref:Aldo/keto reductase family protein n=1 Tax=Brevibacterium aurantiacum TaxID=273384 RepID=A0A2H1JK28_BREAU|nr:aldo/keto reductase [Brevibacterium aurantiacum]AZL04778.1 alcohol dehydrogenase [Brevibacterium aurantiacum]MDN5791800.1 aldo/keto reductase [Brevibacterium aurantiacum]SMX87817.1 Aldo/keto reductase family protein [Brevibacterium aurantiacum]